jgi:hypothetical protein
MESEDNKYELWDDMKLWLAFNAAKKADGIKQSDFCTTYGAKNFCRWRDNIEKSGVISEYAVRYAVIKYLRSRSPTIDQKHPTRSEPVEKEVKRSSPCTPSPSTVEIAMPPMVIEPACVVKQNLPTQETPLVKDTETFTIKDLQMRYGELAFKVRYYKMEMDSIYHAMHRLKQFAD